MRRQNISFADHARQYDPKGAHIKPSIVFELFDYQQEALRAWQQAEQRGVIVLPTGAGKTVVALKAISLAERPALIVVPTLILAVSKSPALGDEIPEEIPVVWFAKRLRAAAVLERAELML